MSATESAAIQNALVEEGYEPLENRSIGTIAAQVHAEELAKDPSNTLAPAEAVVKSFLVGAPENSVGNDSRSWYRQYSVAK